MLVSDIITRVRNQIGDDMAISVSDADIIRWINDGMGEAATDNQLLQKTAVANTVVGTESAIIPTDILKLHSIRYKKMKLPLYSRKEAEEMLPLDGVTTGIPQVGYVWANKIYLWPIPSEVGELEINYTRTPTMVGNVSDTPELPVGYHRRLVDYCLAQVAEMDDDLDRYSMKMGEFKTGVAAHKDIPEWEQDAYPMINVAARDMGDDYEQSSWY